MSCNVEFQGEAGCVYIALSGAEIHENGFEITHGVVRALDEYESDRILIDLREMEGLMPLSQAYELVSTYSKLAPERNIRTAIVEDLDDKHYVSSYELAAGNQGYRISFFADFQEAMSWLAD